MITPALEIARRFEGFSSKPYLCPAGFWTIGFGHLCRQNSPPISEAEGEVYLVSDMELAYVSTLRLCPGLLAEPTSRLAAIVDFTFNLGSGRLAASTLRRRINTGDWPRSKTEIRRWVYGGGRILSGLVARRETEALML